MTVAGTAHHDEAMLGPIQRILRKLIWRARLAMTLRGVFATLAAALIGILAAMGIAARWIIEDAWQDYALTGMWVLAAAVAAWFTLLRPLARAFTLAGIARVIEQRHPELHERISSTVELLTSPDAPEVRGSEALIHALAAEAGRDITTVQPRREITFRRARPPLIVLGVTVAVIVALLAIFPGSTSGLLAKTVVPVLNIGNIHAADIDVTPGDKRAVVLAAGQSLEVTAALLRHDSAVRLKTVELRIEQPGRRDHILEMAALADGTYSQTTGPLTQSTRYRVRAGRALTRYYDVTVVPRPDVESIDVGYDYPDYMARRDTPPQPTEGSETGRIDAPAGTVALVRLTLNKPVDSVHVTLNDKPVTVEEAGPRLHTFRLPLTSRSTGWWRVTLTDRHGHNSRLMEFAVNVTPDTPPAVRIVSAEGRPDKVRPTDRVPVPYEITDDFGIAAAEMIATVDAREAAKIPLPIAAPATTTAASRAGPTAYLADAAMLDLSALDLRGARRVSVQVRALDNLPESLEGPQEGLSDRRTFELDVKAERYAFQVQLAEDLQIREALEAIHRELVAAKKISDPLRRSMPATVRLTAPTTKKLDRLRAHLIEAEDVARRLADATAGGSYPELSETVSNLADKHIGKAGELVGLIKITDGRKQRAEHADEADFQIDRSIAIVSELLKKFQVWTDLARVAAALEELARRQEELAAARAATTQPADGEAARGQALAGDPQDDQQWRDAQREVARDTATAVRQTPGATRESLTGQGRKTTDLSQATQALKKSQQALMQNTAEARKIEAMKQQLAKLAAEQAKLAGQVGRLERRAQPVTPTTQPAAQAHRHAAEAARTLATSQPSDALKPQADAADELDQVARRAGEELARHAAAELARAAEDLARRQDQLADRSAAAKAQQQKASQAAQAAGAEAARQQEIQKQVAQRTRTLAERQAALAAEAKKLEAQAKPSASARPSEPMSQAAQRLREGDPGAAAQQARAGSQKARNLARETERRASTGKQAAAQAARDIPKTAERLKQAARQAEAARKAAVQRARSAQRSADQAAQRARTTDAAARRAAAQAKQRADQAAQAAQAAKQGDQAAQAKARAAAEKARAAQQAHAAAQGQAGQAAEKAKVAQAAAAAAQRQAAQADRQARAAQQSASDPGAEARRQAEAARQARAQSEQATQIAARQEALAKEIAAAVQREAPQVAQAAQAGRRAAQHSARAAGTRSQTARQVAEAARDQRNLAGEAAGLRQMARQATPQAQAAMRRNDPSRNMQRASQELARARPRQAEPPQRAAAEQLRRIAQAARQADAPPSPTHARAAEQAAQQLARQQRSLRRRTAELLGQLARAEARQDQQELVRLQAEQQRLAREAARLADDVRDDAPQPDRIDTHAARATADASRQMAARQLAQAAQTGRRAAGHLGEMARRLAPSGAPAGAEPAGRAGPPDQVQAADPTASQEPEQIAQEPTDADRRGELGRRAGDLARRQQRVAREAQALAERRRQDLLASRQERIAESTGSARAAAELIGDHVGDLLEGDRAQQLADRATQALGQAGQAQAAAQQAIEQGQLARSVPGQRASASALGRAAQALQQLGQVVRQQAQRAEPAPPSPPGQAEDDFPGRLAEAYGATQSAAAGGAESEAARAARLLAALARQANQRAQGMGLVPGQPGMPGMALDPSIGVGRTGMVLSAGELKELGLSPSDWTRLPGRLRDQVLQAARQGAPEAYRGLIKRYFQAIARRSARADEWEGKR